MSRLASLLAPLLVLGVALGTGVPAAGASSARPVPSASATDAGVLEPILSCTSPNDPGKGVDTTVLGYVNHSSSEVRLEPGPWNLLLGAHDVTTPTVFEPGRHPRALEVHVLDGAAARWALGTGDVTGPGPRCKGRLSPALAGSIMRGAMAGGLPLAFVFLVFAFKKRRDTKRTAATV